METIRPARAEDAAAMAEIYNPFIRYTVVTFDEAPVDAVSMADRLAQTTGAGFPWLVVQTAESPCAGYAYAGPWRTRPSYRFTCETAIYLAPGIRRRGRGTRLYRDLLDALRQQGFHAAVGGITLPNPESVNFHEKLGFRKVAHFPEVGWKFNRWLDVGFWQITL